MSKPEPAEGLADELLQDERTGEQGEYLRLWGKIGGWHEVPVCWTKDKLLALIRRHYMRVKNVRLVGEPDPAVSCCPPRFISKKPPKRRRFRRKCAYCGKWCTDANQMTLVGGNGVYRSQSHFAHKACAEPPKRRRRKAK